MKVCLLPQFPAQATGGVAHHIQNLTRYLPAQGVTVVDRPQDADLVHVHAAERAARVDVYTNHGIYPFRAGMPAWQELGNRAIIDNLKQASQVIAVSDWTAQQWTHLVGREPVIIPNGIDPAQWANVPPLGKWGRAVTGRPMLLWGKTAVNDVLDPTPALELALRRPDVDVVLTLTRQWLLDPPPNVYLVGPQPFAQMQRLLADCDVYLATTVENQPIQVLEACALGKPVLAYDWAGTAETLRRLGLGLLVPPGDYAALAQGIDVALQMASSFAASAPAAVARLYDWTQIAARTVAVYEAALAEKQAAARGPQVSIVIPVYNKAAYIADTLRSALTQADAPPYEVVVIDDGSTDNSVAVVQQTLKEWGQGAAGWPVTFLGGPNQGVARARNTAIRHARGQYICALDADDQLDPYALARLSAQLAADPGCGIAYSDMLIFGTHPDSGPYAGYVQTEEFDIEKLKQQNVLPCCNLFRKRAWAAAGGYKPVIDRYGSSWEDYELWLNMAKLGWHGRRVPGTLFHYRKVAGVGRDADSQPHTLRLRGIVRRLHRDLYAPVVSVVIPCYGQSRFLAQAIQSVMAQTFADVEVIVVDDGNGPEEAAAIAQIVAEANRQARAQFNPAATWDDVRLVRLPQNRGLAAARNAGVAAAQGELLLPLDADDLLAPTCIEQMLQALNWRKDRFVYTDITMLWEDTGQTSVLKAQEFDKAALMWHVSWACTILYHREMFAKAGGYKEAMSAAGGWEDWEFALALADAGYSGLHVAEPLFIYRQHGPHQMRKQAEANKPQLRELLRRLHPQMVHAAWQAATYA